MPNLLQPKQTQFTQEQANESRLVTKVRWVVESVNGRLKNVFKFFRGVISNNYLADNKLRRFVRISCAFLNAFFPVIRTEKPGDRELAQFMIDRAELSNVLQLKLTSTGLIRKRVCWVPVRSGEIQDFPHLSPDELLEITVGIFQIKLAPSYLAHLCAHQRIDDVEAGDLHLWFYRDDPTLLRFRMPSRFSSAHEHQVWVQYEPYSTIGVLSINCWYCTCRSGARTVGCCAHVACVLWYLGFARHQPGVRFPAQHLGNTLLSAQG